jgi:hypothetical protein
MIEGEMTETRIPVSVISPRALDLFRISCFVLRVSRAAARHAASRAFSGSGNSRSTVTCSS